VSQIKIRASQSGIEASAGFSGQQEQPAKASIPEDYLNIYSLVINQGGGIMLRAIGGRMFVRGHRELSASPT
jgi:hypothetical protein